MTKQHKKILLICIGIIVASYVVRSIVLGAMQAAYIHQQAIRAAEQRANKKAADKARAEAKAAEAAKAPLPAPAEAPKEPPIPEIFAKLPGIWHGRAALTGRGLCDMKLELKSTEPGNFQGYSSLSCLAVPALMSKEDRMNPKTGLLSRLTPDVAILAGTVKDGAIQLNTEKAIGSDIHGCALDLLTLTPFATNQLAAEWQGDGCEGGRMVLGRPTPMNSRQPVLPHNH